MGPRNVPWECHRAYPIKESKVLLVERRNSMLADLNAARVTELNATVGWPFWSMDNTQPKFHWAIFSYSECFCLAESDPLGNRGGPTGTPRCSMVALAAPM